MQEKADKKEKLKEPVKVVDIILFTIANLETKAWAYLGLVSHPETGEKLMDKKQAKLAIDSLDALYQLVKEEIPANERKNIELMLTNLRLNYVKTG